MYVTLYELKHEVDKTITEGLSLFNDMVKKKYLEKNYCVVDINSQNTDAEIS